MKPDPAVIGAIATLAARLPEALTAEAVRLLGRHVAGPPPAYVPAAPPVDAMARIFEWHEGAIANARLACANGRDPFAVPERPSLRDALAAIGKRG